MLGLLLAAPAAAQGDVKHDGFNFGAGLGIGWAKYNGDATNGTTESALGGLRLGGHVSRTGSSVQRPTAGTSRRMA